MTTCWALTIGAITIATYVVSSIRAWWRLREFNGPFLASFSYLWITRASYSGRMGERWTETEAKYGTGTPSTVRIGPNELLTSDPDVIRRTSAARSKYTRSDWYKLSTVDPYEDAMLNVLDTAEHDKIKAQTAPGYAGRDNPGLESEVDMMLNQLTNKIRTKYAAAKPGDQKPMLDLATIAQYFTLDSISKIAFGEEFGLVEAERDIHGHIEALNDAAPAAVTIAAVPHLRAIFASDLVLKLIGPSPKDKKGLGRIMATGKAIVRKRFAQEDAKDQQDMLGSFMRHGLSQRKCETEALIQIIAGSDTTATTIRVVMLYLMSTPRAYQALQGEIDAGIKAGRISSPVTSAEAQEMPYLQAVIIEALRLFPPFTGIPFKAVPPQGDTIDGKHVPGGTLIAPNFWTTGRNRAVFGADVEVFRPERWLEADAAAAESGDRERRAEMRRVAELAFGYGRWGCAGKMIAFLELNKVFVETDMWVSVALRESEAEK
ncbi:cytochrome P450 [Chaetomium tenue]|uniref:Cytochrome P450 n=1 Tax=Chaetomium tenue TaxID=1854479 RepID=A0ACB7P4M0_9PEZI|nr:cytochrome P450 [Chaetomium globosum]